MMEMLQYHAPVNILEPPGRVLDATSPFFPDYGYQSSKTAIKAISRSLNKKRVPHVICVVGKPKNGKEHIVRDVVSRLYYQNPEKKNEGILQRIEKEQGYQVPVDVVYWGNAFSVAKITGKIPEDGIYGQIRSDAMEGITEEYEDLIGKAVAERQDQAAVIIVKGILVTGASIEDNFYGVNRGFTAFEKIAKREGCFKGLNFEDYWFGQVAEPGVMTRGNDVRTKSEELLNKPAELVQWLKNSGEIILTEQGNEEEFSEEYQQGIIEYISESANTAASEEIRYLVNSLAVRLIEARQTYFYKTARQRMYFWDDINQVYRFPGFDDETKATGAVMRYILEKNFGLTTKSSPKRVFLGRGEKLEDIIFDCRVRMRNVAKSYYPGIQSIRNK